MISLEQTETRHFGQSVVIRADEPVHIEITVDDAGVLAYVYRGAEDDPDADPVGGWDSMFLNNYWRVG